MNCPNCPRYVDRVELCGQCRVGAIAVYAAQARRAQAIMAGSRVDKRL